MRRLEKLKRGAILTEILRQDKDKPVPQEIQVIIFYAFNKKMMNDLTIPEVRVFQDELFDYARKKNPDLLKLIREKRKLEPDIEKGITDLVDSLCPGHYRQAQKRYAG